MARIRRKKALYEVISQTQRKQGLRRLTSQPAAGKSPEEEQPPEGPAEPAEATQTSWPRQPRLVQFNAGRIELSLPYQLAVAIVLGLVLVVLAFYRLGQWSYETQRPAGVLPPQPPATGSAGTGQPETAGVSEQPAEAAATPMLVSGGDNVIVIQQYHRRRDLEPVRQHFREYGIETEIIDRTVGNRTVYLLVTKNRYDNPDKPGTDGYEAKKRIVRVGALYKSKAPPGYETFGPRYFSDAYGMKIDR